MAKEKDTVAKESEGKVVDNSRVAARDAQESVKTTDVKAMDDGTEGRLVLAGPLPPSAPELSEEALEQGPTESAPEEGLGDNVQVPVFTPGVYAPISSKLLPNVQRDAQLVMAAREDANGFPERRSLRLDPDATGPRDARDLAVVLRSYPHWVNTLDDLENLEKTEGKVPHPDGWVRNPVDLLEESKRYNMYFV